MTEEAGLLDSPVSGSSHALGEHLGSCLDVDGCAFGERRVCPCVAWRLGFTLAEILEPHVGERGQAETPPEALRRILKERQALRAADAVAKLGGDVMAAIRTASERLLSRRPEHEECGHLRRARDTIWSIADDRKDSARVEDIMGLRDAASVIGEVSYAWGRDVVSRSDGDRMRQAADRVREVAVRWQDTPDGQLLLRCAVIIREAADRVDGPPPPQQPPSRSA